MRISERLARFLFCHFDKPILSLRILLQGKFHQATVTSVNLQAVESKYVSAPMIYTFTRGLHAH